MINRFFNCMVFLGAVVLHCSLFAEDTDTINETEIKQRAFEEVKEAVAPLSTKQMHELRNLFNETQRAASYHGESPTRPTSSSLVVDLSPGAVPPVVRLGAGYVTSLVFVDSTGAPWPIKAYDIGNPNLFNVQWHQDVNDEKNGDAMTNTLLIQAQTMFRDANLAVVLRGMNTPVMITLLTGQKAVDYRVDMHIPRMGPNAVAQIGLEPGTGSPTLIDFVNNVPPQNSKRLTVKGITRTDAYQLGSTMFIRSPHRLVSPAWVSTMSGADGTIHVYELPKSTTLLMIDHGQVRTVTIEGETA